MTKNTVYTMSQNKTEHSPLPDPHPHWFHIRSILSVVTLLGGGLNILQWRRCLLGFFLFFVERQKIELGFFLWRTTISLASSATSQDYNLGFIKYQGLYIWGLGGIILTHLCWGELDPILLPHTFFLLDQKFLYIVWLKTTN